MRLPNRPFYLFGMGSRRKLLYRAGVLADLFCGEQIAIWSVAAEQIDRAGYAVRLTTTGGGAVRIVEDADGVWIEEDGSRRCAAEGAVRLPDFGGRRHAALLRALHHEVLINVVDGKPVPNLLAYPKPWRRDAAMMALCLERTGNAALIADWIRGLTDVFDRNNAGAEEADNIGQTLYLASLVGDSSHPAAQAALAAIARFQTGKHIAGKTDFGDHPVYQTKWLKFGLRRLSLSDPYSIPSLPDTYSALFWMDYRDEHVACGRFDAATAERYPYLRWAEAHFHREPPPMELLGPAYPVTWEAEASQAGYDGMRRINPEYADRRIAAPHSWHAAEALLYLLDRPASTGAGERGLAR